MREEPRVHAGHLQRQLRALRTPRRRRARRHARQPQPARRRGARRAGRRRARAPRTHLPPDLPVHRAAARGGGGAAAHLREGAQRQAGGRGRGVGAQGPRVAAEAAVARAHHRRHRGRCAGTLHDLHLLPQRGAHRHADQPAARLHPLGHAPLQRRRRLAGARGMGRHGQPLGRMRRAARNVQLQAAAVRQPHAARRTADTLGAHEDAAPCIPACAPVCIPGALASCWRTQWSTRTSW